jgi:hypothetical protein
MLAISVVCEGFHNGFSQTEIHGLADGGLDGDFTHPDGDHVNAGDFELFLVWDELRLNRLEILAIRFEFGELAVGQEIYQRGFSQRQTVSDLNFDCLNVYRCSSHALERLSGDYGESDGHFHLVCVVTLFGLMRIEFIVEKDT